MSVQFSYPTLGGDAPSQGFFTYSDPAKNQYVSFTPSKIVVTKNKLYIEHYATGITKIYVIFTLKEEKKTDLLQDTKTKQIKLDNLIIQEINSKKSSFSLDGSINYKYDTTAYTFTSGTHVFEMPGAIRVSKIGTTGNAPTLTTTKNIKIPLTKSSFGSDDTMVCDEANVDETASNTISTSGNTTLNIGVVMFSAFLLMGFLTLIKKFMPDLIIFEANTGLLQGFASNIAYAVITGLFFILSFAFFIANGVKPKNVNLIVALVFLVFTIIMMWFKVAVFTAPAIALA